LYATRAADHVYDAALWRVVASKPASAIAENIAPAWKVIAVGLLPFTLVCVAVPAAIQASAGDMDFDVNQHKRCCHA